jgi:transcriptional regulator CtsR
VNANLLNRKNKSLVVKEHVIPLNIIVSFLSKIPTKELSIEKVKEILDSLLIYATITKEEDKLISKIGLGRKMTIEYETIEELKANAFDRYKHVNIVLVRND